MLRTKKTAVVVAEKTSRKPRAARGLGKTRGSKRHALKQAVAEAIQNGAVVIEEQPVEPEQAAVEQAKPDKTYRAEVAEQIRNNRNRTGMTKSGKPVAKAKTPKAKREPVVKVKEPKLGAPCFCGCGKDAKHGRNFRAGHDQRSKGYLIKAHKGEFDLVKECPLLVQNHEKVPFIALDERFAPVIKSALARMRQAHSAQKEAK